MASLTNERGRLDIKGVVFIWSNSATALHWLTVTERENWCFPILFLHMHYILAVSPSGHSSPPGPECARSHKDTVKAFKSEVAIKIFLPISIPLDLINPQSYFERG